MPSPARGARAPGLAAPPRGNIVDFRALGPIHVLGAPLPARQRFPPRLEALRADLRALEREQGQEQDWNPIRLIDQVGERPPAPMRAPLPPRDRLGQLEAMARHRLINQRIGNRMAMFGPGMANIENARGAVVAPDWHVPFDDDPPVPPPAQARLPAYVPEEPNLIPAHGPLGAPRQRPRQRQWR